MSFLTPGSDAKKARGEQRGNEATAAWTNLGKQIPNLHPADYQYGPDLQAPKERTLDTPEARAAAGLQSESAAASGSSAYNDLGPGAYSGLGPSSFQDATSAYKDMGPSAASNLGFNQADLSKMGASQGYFSDLTKTGNDPIAEADYQRRAAQAEQSRAQNTDAALSALETKGLGNAGGQLMARMSGVQDAANARYQAGLDTTAAAAARRDYAAGQASDIASQMGQNQSKVETDRAEALDKYNQSRAAGLDDATAKRASGLDKYATDVAQGQDKYATDVASGKDVYGTNRNTAIDLYGQNRYKDWYDTQHNNADRAFLANQANTSRAWTVNDTNVAQQNAVPQQTFNNQMAVTAGKSNSLHGQANEIPQGASASGLGVLPQVVQMGGNVAKGIGAATR